MKQAPARCSCSLAAVAGAERLRASTSTSCRCPAAPTSGDDPITVHVKFRDVLDLVPQSTVKVNDVNVGKVTDIQLDGYTADVTLELRNDTKLPDNAVAEIRQTSLLGEKFVSLEPPETGSSSELLATGDVIPLERTGRNPEVEEVLGALSLLLNGGGVAQLQDHRAASSTWRSRDGRAPPGRCSTRSAP